MVKTLSKFKGLFDVCNSRSLRLMHSLIITLKGKNSKQPLLTVLTCEAEHDSTYLSFTLPSQGAQGGIQFVYCVTLMTLYFDSP
jgi:hypothetical protein